MKILKLIKVILILHIPIFLFNCKYNNDIKVTLKGDTLKEELIMIDSLNHYKNFRENYLNIPHIYPKAHRDSTLEVFKINNCCFSFVSNTDLKKYNNPNINYIFEEEFAESLLFINESKEIVLFLDSITFRDHTTNFIKTKIFCYCTGIIKGSYQIFDNKKADYISSIIFFKKMVPHVFKISEFKREKIIIVEQLNQNLRIVTTMLEESYPLHFYIINKLTDHMHLGEFVSTGVYKEYIYNEKLQLVAKKIIDEDDI